MDHCHTHYHRNQFPDLALYAARSGGGGRLWTAPGVVFRTAREYVSIMGPSGSGKSTLLNIMGLLNRPDSGIYRLEHVVTTDLTEKQQAEVRRTRSASFSVLSSDSPADSG